eukprot:356656-Chlamydomonas_euryale.AAC.3
MGNCRAFRAEERTPGALDGAGSGREDPWPLRVEAEALDAVRLRNVAVELQRRACDNGSISELNQSPRTTAAHAFNAQALFHAARSGLLAQISCSPSSRTAIVS